MVECAELLAAMIEPRTDRGLVVLFHIADHVATLRAVRDHIAAHLAAHEFERLVPDWRAALDARTARFGALARKLMAGDEASLRPLARLALDS